MKYWLTGIIVFLLGLAAWYYLASTEPVVEEAAPAPIAPSPAQPEPEPEPEPEARAEPAFEVASEAETSAATEPPLPDLADSDAQVLEVAAELVGPEPVEEYLTHENVISRVVATVNALSARQIPPVIQVMQGPGGEFAVIPDPEPESVIRNALGDPLPQFTLDPDNFARYTPYVEMLEQADPVQVREAYARYQELFEEAFRQLGYPKGGFEERLVVVIDELLATPEVVGPIRLVKPEAYYRFADERLERLSAGQKILLRMGPENAARVKTRLAEIRTALAAMAPAE